MYKKILFPIHIFQVNIKENQLLLDDLLPPILNCIEYNQLEIPDGWQTTKLKTSFGKDNINNQILSKSDILISTYKSYINKLTDNDFDVRFDSMWFNYYENGEYQEKHTHLTPIHIDKRSHFSAIHFLKFDSEVHNSVTFWDPIETFRYNSLEIPSNRYSNVYEPKVVEGDLIVFPPYLEHSVKSSVPSPNNPRISIAFNFRLNFEEQNE